MTLRALTVALAVSVGVALVAPGTAEARHRHDRYCRHDRHYDRYDRDRYDRYDRHDRYDRYDRRHDRRDYRDYRYRRNYGYSDRYYYAPPPPRVSWHYHGHRRCSRSHVGFWFGW